MADITMSLDDTLELDTIIKESTEATDPISYDTNKFKSDGIQKHTGILKPQNTGTYTININGQELVVEVTGSSIPDKKDLKAWYDATKLSYSDGDSVSIWEDKNSNYNLTEGTAPTYKEDIIDRNSVVRFDGSNDYLNVEWSKISQPYHIFAVFKVRRIPSGEHNYPLSNNSGNNSVFSYRSGNSFGWRLNSGTTEIDGGSVDKNVHVGSFLFNGESSLIRLDGNLITSGDAGSNGLKGLKIGTHPDNILYAKIDFGEILIYTKDKTNNQEKIENYLLNKWWNYIMMVYLFYILMKILIYNCIEQINIFI